MNNGGVVQLENEPHRDVAPPDVENPIPLSRAALLEHWLLNRLDALALAVVAVGAIFRIIAATRSYLNPDEALHYMLLNQSSAFLAYKASLTNAHPPLIYLVLYYWHFLGQSELMLRMPSVIAGTAFCWMIYKWMGLAFGRAASWIGLILVTFSPAMVALSAEVRAYALLLFSMGGALYFLERAFAEKSVREMWLFSVFLYLAILSHYSAAFFALAAGVYALARIADSHLPRKAIIAWALGQAGALAIYGFLYETHLSKLKNNIAMWSMGFGTSYFHPDSINIFTFTGQNTLNIFLFLFGERYVAWMMLLCFVAGVAIFFARGLQSRHGNLQSNRLGILLLFPFLAVWGASIAGIYPYIGSRHTAFLAPFAVAAASYVVAAASRQKLWAGIVIAVLLMLVCNTAHGSVPSEEAAENQSPAFMHLAVSYMEQSVPRGDLLLVDYQSSLPLTYYLCGPKVIFPKGTFGGDYFEFSCNGYSVISLHIWKLIPEGFRPQFENMARSHNLKPGTRVWVYQTGWGVDLGTELANHAADFRCLAPKRFGGGVTVTPFIVGPDFLPESPLGSC
jgi:Dolichyl-phosphate-mannose-protein mannosyltransferase